MVRAVFSRQVAWMLFCNGLVLVYVRRHDTVADVVETVVFVVLTVCGEAPATGFVWSTIAVPEQSLLSYAWNWTLPARLPVFAGAVIVAESFGMNDCADVIDEATAWSVLVNVQSIESPGSSWMATVRVPRAGVAVEPLVRSDAEQSMLVSAKLAA